jgi:hypothetical protein
MKKTRTKTWLTPLALMLALAVGLQCIPSKEAPYHVPEPEKLSAMAPVAVNGWEVREQPLGDTESLREQVQQILQFEQAFFRVYRRGGTDVGVYVAYWGADQEMHPMDAATHSPDLCWINAGWREERHDYAYRLQDGVGQDLKIAQFRVFTMENGARQEVLFWHLMGGRLSGYALGPSSRWRARLPVLWDNKVNNLFGLRKREQFFIRISTNRTVEELVADPLWREIVAGLAPAGLLEEAATNDERRS